MTPAGFEKSTRSSTGGAAKIGNAARTQIEKVKYRLNANMIQSMLVIPKRIFADVFRDSIGCD
jgi:hypothetical protein